MKTMKCAELVLDFDLYPRNNVDSHNVTNLCNALSAGIELPPVIIDKKSKRVVDGFHRVRAHLRLYGENATIQVIDKAYKSEADMFRDAMRYNATHGAKLDPCDKTHCCIIAARLEMPLHDVAAALNMPLTALQSLKVERTGYDRAGQPLPLKNTIRARFSGKRLNKRQEEANSRLSGMNQQFYANQLIELIESEMLDTEDANLMERLTLLNKLLDGILQVAN